MEAMECLLNRRSVRSYNEKQVPEDVLNQILEAGLYAPSGMGLQTVKFVVVKDAETVAKLSKMNAAVMGADSDPFYGANMVVIVFADTTSGVYLQDGSLAMGNLMNAAFALGVDSCWIDRARQMFDSEEGKAMKAAWGLAESFVGIGNCILGYSDKSTPAAKARTEGRIIFA